MRFNQTCFTLNQNFGYTTCEGFTVISNIAQCCQVKRNKEEINREGHEEREEKISFNKLLRELRVLRGEKNP